MTARSFTLKDGTVTISRSDGPPCPAWHCVISQPPSVRAGMAYTARDALRVARGGKAAMTMSVALPPAAPVGAAQAGDTETVPLAAIRARIERAREESMALRHRIGTKDTLAALDVLVDQAIRAQEIALLQASVLETKRNNEELKRGQAALQAELDALRAQLAAAKSEPDATAAQEAAETPSGPCRKCGASTHMKTPAGDFLCVHCEHESANGGEASEPNAPGEAAAPTPTQEAQQ